MTTTSMCKTIF